MKYSTIVLRALCVVLAACGSVPSPASAYDDQTTHPAITDEIVDFYNLSFPESPITAEEREWVVEGSMREDTWPRWINHFYDAAYKTGWSGRHAGRVDADTVMAFSRAVLSVKEEPASAVEWLNGDLLQKSYRYYGGNRSWPRGLDHYAAGEREEAYRTLGHSLHLLEDLTVPDHVRDDTHAHPLREITGDYGSPYESYAKRFTPESIGALGIPDMLRSEGIRPPARDQAADYLVAAAEYAGKHFFSKDTVSDPRYIPPRPVREDSDFAYGLDEKGREYPLAKVVRRWSADGSSETYLRLGEQDTDVLAEYFSRLSRKAVTEGAGMVALFKRQAADAVANKDFPSSLVEFDARKLVIPTFSLAAEAKKVAVAVWNAIGRFFTDDTQSDTRVVMDNATEHDAISSVASVVPISGEATPGRVIGAQDIPATIPSSATEVENDIVRARLDRILEEARAVQARITALTPVATSTAATSTKKSVIPAPPKPIIITSTPLPVPLSGGGSSVSSSGGGASSPSGGGSGSGGSSATEATPPTVPALRTDGHVVISEVRVAGAGGAGDEFIELYNVENEPIDISEWSVQYVSGASSLESLKKKNLSGTSTIPAHGYFLLARGLSGDGDDGYVGSTTPDLVQRTLSLSGAASGGTVFLVKNDAAIDGADDPDLADRVAYGASDGLLPEGAPTSLPKPGESIERKALLEGGTCADALDSAEFSGNGCDTGVNLADFVIRDHPMPQAIANLPEPRQAPEPNGFSVEYASGTVSLFFTWEAAKDMEGTTNIRYVVHDVQEGDAPASVCEATRALACSTRVPAVGKSYKLSLTAYDRDGFGGSSSPVLIDAPTFIRDVAFYRDPRSTSYEPSYLLDFVYAGAPFIPHIFGRPGFWQGMAFYLNRPANNGNHTISTASQLALEDGDGALPVDRGGGSIPVFVFALDPELAPGFGEGLRGLSMGAIPGEDRRIRLHLFVPPGPALTAEDYLTIGYYDFSNSGGGRQDLSLVAIDANQYRFHAATPSFLPPEPVPEVTASFDTLLSSITVQWATSTDPDSADAGLTYEVNITSLPVCPEDGWQPGGREQATSTPVVFGNAYTIGVRAVDEFGNASAPTVITWGFPNGYAPLPVQDQSDVLIGYNGEGRGQHITMNRDASLRAVAMVLGNGGGLYWYAQSFLRIHRDASGGIGEVIAESAPIAIDKWTQKQESVYRFSDPVMVHEGESYWLVPAPGPDATNQSFVYGGNGDPSFIDSWNASPELAAYFRLSE